MPFWLVALIVVFSALVAEQLLEDELNLSHQSEHELKVQDRLSALTTRLQGTISENLKMINGISSALIVFPKLDQQQFDSIVGELFHQQKQKQLRNLALAPDMTIKYVYPLETNEKALGLNLASHPQQKAAALRARDTGETVLAGPIELVQGGLGLAGRIPYYKHDPDNLDNPDKHRFVGLISAVIDLDQLFEEVGLKEFEEEIDLAIRGRDGLGEQGEVFFGNASLFAQPAVLSAIQITPATRWVVAASPKGGWNTQSPMQNSVRILSALITSIILIFMYLQCRLTNRLSSINQVLKREVDARTKSDRQLAISESRYRDISNSMADWIWEVDAQGIYTFIDGNVKNSIGYEAEELIGKSPFEFMPEEEAARVGALFAEIVSKQLPIEDLENWNITKDGRHICLLTNGVPILDGQGNLLGYRGVDKDITDRKLADETLQRFKKIIDSANEAIVVTDIKGVIIDINPAYETITGYSRDELIGSTPGKLKSDRHDKAFYETMWQAIDSDGSWQGEIWDRRKNGETFPKWLSINTLYDSNGEPGSYVGLFSDISDKKKAEEKLVNLAYYDPLTKLPNRSHFHERLIADLADASRRKEKLALLYIDLDHFKYVNDTFGHASGDALLVTVARRLSQRLREKDTIARLGGDEFAVILTGIDSSDTIPALARKLSDAINEPILIQGQEIQVGASIGISLFPDDTTDDETLVQNADAAMYHAKKKTRSDFQFFNEDINQRNKQRLIIENNLRRAIKNEEFELYYQPQIDIFTEEVIGSEALIRWNDPEKGLIPPLDFIPIAEETGLILEIGAWTFKQACKQLRNTMDEGKTPIRVAINLSAVQFRDKGLVEMIVSSLKHENISAEWVELEITESAIMENADAATEILEQLSEHGIRISIDDFGTGYSSLAYLKNFPVDKLKIDREFIRGLPHNNDDIILTTVMINLAHSLGIVVLAEGAETREQIDFLRRQGCHYVQGYYYSKPLPHNEFEMYISSMSGNKNTI